MGTADGWYVFCSSFFYLFSFCCFAGHGDRWVRRVRVCVNTHTHTHTHTHVFMRVCVCMVGGGIEGVAGHKASVL
jgi:hypothetical protein